MGFNDILTKLFGNKSQRDLKEINPYVEKIKATYPAIEALSNDELRALSNEIRNKIQASVSGEWAEITRLKEEIETLELEDREKPYEQIDKIEKDITEKLEKALDEALPQAFSIVKDTARRFKENENIVVTATDFDRDLA
ncbi:MAG: preprotein translocase subunit SecA, partial [Bacteroidales bacterium]|nr:preprotein translocase subunit SecA [Bacteroidales bacterium]